GAPHAASRGRAPASDARIADTGPSDSSPENDGIDLRRALRLQAFFSSLGGADSNRHNGIQSPGSCHWTTSHSAPDQSRAGSDDPIVTRTPHDEGRTISI